MHPCMTHPLAESVPRQRHGHGVAHVRHEAVRQKRRQSHLPETLARRHSVVRSLELFEKGPHPTNDDGGGGGGGGGGRRRRRHLRRHDRDDDFGVPATVVVRLLFLFGGGVPDFQQRQYTTPFFVPSSASRSFAWVTTLAESRSIEVLIRPTPTPPPTEEEEEEEEEEEAKRLPAAIRDNDNGGGGGGVGRINIRLVATAGGGGAKPSADRAAMTASETTARARVVVILGLLVVRTLGKK